MTDVRLSRPEISAAIGDLGWRFIFGAIHTRVETGSVARAADVVARVVATAGGAAEGRLRLDVRPDAVIFTVQSPESAWVTAEDIALARRITSTVTGLGLAADPGVGSPRPLQLVEIGIDALDIPAIRPFWKAILGYVDEAGSTDPEDPIVDPARQGPAIWFQQMDAPRPQRNRVHFDIGVPHDEAPRRIEAALAAGGTLRYDGKAPAFWVLADAEGNEACVCTWEGREGTSLL